MPLYFFYTMVQKSQKWPKTQIKGGPALIFEWRGQIDRITMVIKWRQKIARCSFLIEGSRAAGLPVCKEHDMIKQRWQQRQQEQEEAEEEEVEVSFIFPWIAIVLLCLVYTYFLRPCMTKKKRCKIAT